ncbi:MAG TPA: Ig-like domain-containing protein, partial [Pirellulales bacterium]|nr:Ig-like domain-containing protein [Pirellulales bacterium]
LLSAGVFVAFSRDWADRTHATETFAITVNFVNQPPSFMQSGDPPAVNENATPPEETVNAWAKNISVGPPSQANETLSFVVVSDNSPNLFAVPPAIDATSGDLTYTLAQNEFGTAHITVELVNSGGTANGGNDTSPEQSFDITVNQVINPPSVNIASPPQTVRENAGLQYVADFVSNIVAGTPGAQVQPPVVTNTNPSLFAVQPTLDFSSGTPTADLVYEANSNTFGTATVTATFSQSETSSPAASPQAELRSPAEVSLQPVAAGQTQTDNTTTKTFVIDIQPPFTPTATSQISETEGTAFTVPLASFHDTTFGTYSATIDWGDGQSTTVTLSPAVSGNFTVTGTHAYAEARNDTINVTLSDPRGNAVSAQVTAVVADAALTASATAVPATEGVTFSGAVATFVDANKLGKPGDYSATIDWGDHSSMTTVSGSQITGSNGSYSIAAGHVYADEGTYTLGVTIDDIGGESTAVSSVLHVADAPLTAGALMPPVVTEGKAFGPLSVFHFSDANPSATPADFAATVVTGDATLTSSAGPQEVSIVADSVAGQSGSGFDVKLAYAYATQLSDKTFSVSVADKGGESASSGTASFSVADQPLVVVPASLSATQGTAATFAVVTFTDPGGAQAIGDYSATINWGDGTTTDDGTIALDSGVFTISGTHTYTEAGAMSPVVTVGHGTATPVTATASISVAPSGTLTVIDETYTISSGRVSISAASGLLTGDNGAKPLSVTAGTVTGAQGGTFVISDDGSFTYTPAGNFPGYDSAQFTVSDASGKSANATVTVLSQHAGVVWKFYEAVLNREPDPAGLQYWTNYFNSGGNTGDMAFGFFESDELLDKIITEYYQQYLDRTPDASG